MGGHRRRKLPFASDRERIAGSLAAGVTTAGSHGGGGGFQSLSVRSGSSPASTAPPPPPTAELSAAFPTAAVGLKLPGHPKLTSSSPTKNGIGPRSPRAGFSSAATSSRRCCCCSGCAAAGDACAWMPMGYMPEPYSGRDATSA
nr:unnamed protein product [Digitaria exilis]